MGLSGLFRISLSIVSSSFRVCSYQLFSFSFTKESTGTAACDLLIGGGFSSSNFKLFFAELPSSDMFPKSEAFPFSFWSFVDLFWRVSLKGLSLTCSGEEVLIFSFWDLSVAVVALCGTWGRAGCWAWEVRAGHKANTCYFVCTCDLTCPVRVIKFSTCTCLVKNEYLLFQVLDQKWITCKLLAPLSYILFTSTCELFKIFSEYLRTTY